MLAAKVSTLMQIFLLSTMRNVSIVLKIRFESICYSQFTSRVTNISENKMNIRISLCNVTCEWNVEHFSGNLSENDALTEKKIRFKILGKQ